MTRRHEALIPLTHDHHHFLAHSRRMQEAVSGDDAVRRKAADDFVSFYLGKALRNMREEQELFFPAAFANDRARPLILKAVEEHFDIHDRTHRLQEELFSGEVSPETLGRLAEVLTAHVRYEEGELFSAIEEAVPDEELVRLGTSGRRDV